MTEEITINGKTYVEKTDNRDEWITKNTEGKTCCLVRTYSAGVFYGYVDYDKKDTFFDYEIFDATHIWSWSNKSLTTMDLATTNKTTEAKLSNKVPVIKVNRVIEIVPMTVCAIKNLEQMERNNGY